MIVKSLLLVILLMVQYQIVNKLFTLVDKDEVEKWGSLLVNLLVLSLFTFKYLQSFNLFSKGERLSLVAGVVGVVIVFWLYNYVDEFRHLFVNESESISESEEQIYEETLVEEEETIKPEKVVIKERPEYLKDFVGFDLGKRLTKEKVIELQPYLNSDKDFSKYYHKNRYSDNFDYRFSDLYYQPKPEKKQTDKDKKKYHKISVKDYTNITDFNKYRVRTDTKYIPEKMDHLITM